MKRTIKLVIYYLLYQLLCTMVVMTVAWVAMAIGSVDVHGNPGALVQTLQSADLSGNTTVIALGVLLAAVVMVWHLVHFRYIRVENDFLHTKGSIVVLLVCIPFVYTAMFLVDTLCGCLDLPDLMEESFLDMSHNVWGILSMAVAAPVVEECLFRGAIEGHLLRTWKRPWLAIAVSALVFGLVHMNPVQMVAAFLAGLVLGWLYYRTGSVLPSIVGHILNNSVAVVTMRVCSSDTQSLEELAGEGALPWFIALYSIVFVMCAVFLSKKLHRGCNLSEE